MFNSIHKREYVDNFKPIPFKDMFFNIYYIL